MAKRTLYGKEEYREKTEQLQRLVDGCTSLDISANAYQVKGAPGELNHVQYVDAAEMANFAQLAEFDCRLIKLINYGRPAIELSFFTKHKYYVDKKPPLDEVKAVLAYQLSVLTDKHIENDQSESNLLLEGQIKKISTVLKQASKHQYAFSNYNRCYTYSYVQYRYFSGLGRSAIDSANTHLIKHTTDRDGEVTIERTNVIFVDVEALSHRISYDNKQVDTFLAGFPKQINCGKYDLYVK